MNMQMKNSHDAVRKLISMQIQDFCVVRGFTKKKKWKQTMAAIIVWFF